MEGKGREVTEGKRGEKAEEKKDTEKEKEENCFILLLHFFLSFFLSYFFFLQREEKKNLITRIVRVRTQTRQTIETTMLKPSGAQYNGNSLQLPKGLTRLHENKPLRYLQ